MGPTGLKVILLILMAVLTILFGLLPVKALKLLRQRAATQNILGQRLPSLILCLLTCFTGGVFFATCLLHLLPEATERMTELKKEYDWHTHYPVAELLSCIGFFLVFLLEEVVLLCLRRNGKGGHQGPSITHVHHHVEHSDDPCSGRSTPTDNNPHENAPLQVKSEPSKSPRSRIEFGTNNMINGADGVGGQDTDRSGTTHREDMPCCGEIYHREVEVGTGTTEVCHVVHAEPECCEVPCSSASCDNPPIKMGYKPHAHHHGVRSVTLVIALSLHSVIEGLAFGIQDTNNKVWMLFASIILHKCIVAFSVGLQLARTHSHQVGWIVLSVLALAAMSPIGAGIGIGVNQIESQSRDIILLVVEGLCVGTFIYVTFFEVFAHERDNEHPNLLKLFVILLGFSCIAGIRTLEHSHGDHGHDHANHTEHHH